MLPTVLVSHSLDGTGAVLQWYRDDRDDFVAIP